LGERNPIVLRTLGAAIDDRKAHPVLLGRDFDVTDNRVALGGRYLGIRTTERAHDGLFLPLHGAHQGVNAAVALQAVTSFIPTKQLDDEVILEGFSGVEVPGRVETIALEQEPHPTVVLDVAHNPEGMSALVATLAETFAFDRVLFVVGVLADKDHAGMLQELTRLPCVLFLCAPRSGRARPVEELAAAATEIGLDQSAFDEVEPAVSAAIASATTGDLICITGSHYVVGEARSFLMP
jgi:dihydrofolate synthase/folylpolyglutamate synthase